MLFFVDIDFIFYQAPSLPQPEDDLDVLPLTFSCVDFRMFALILSFSVRMSHSDTDLKARVQAMSLVDLHKKLDGAKVCLLYCCNLRCSHLCLLHSAHVLCQLRADIIGISMNA